jgi:hypothetical protein
MQACVSGGCTYACDATYTACSAGGSAPACLLTNPSTTTGVFVATGGGTNPSLCGGEASPCGTITVGLAAIAQSAGTRNIIYVANGTYTEQVTLAPGVTIQGGWLYSANTWTHWCTANPQTGAVIQAPTGTGTTVIANFAAAGSATLDTLTIQSIPMAAPGQSLYGIMATGSATSLTLNNVDISVAAGGPGAPGMPGAGGAAATAACTGSPQSGGAGGNGNAGSGAPVGNYSATGYAPSTGQNGGLTTAATAGQCGSPPGSAQTTMVDNMCGDPGGTGCGEVDPFACTSKAGICGAGGNPGTPGTGGVGGGSSIGLFVWGGASVTVTGSAVGTGNGGAGGAGGTGGNGGGGYLGPNGANGVYGPATTDCTNHCVGKPSEQVCSCLLTNSVICATGGAGTLGGPGGAGGNGGGGNGGDSYCWYAGGGGSVSATPSECSAGSGGTGGTGGATPGATGNSGHVP